MLLRIPVIALVLTAFVTALPGFAQSTDATPAAATATTAIPSLIRYSGTAPRSDSKAEPLEVSITFLIYKDKQGSDPLWTETQTVAVDPAGHYDVLLGATSANGLPSDLFASGEARWLEVQISGGKPGQRTMLVSVPYAMKAADAATLGGLPASAFLLAGTKSSEAQSAAASPEASSHAVTTPGGTAGYVPVYSGAVTVDDSILFESGTRIGIDTNTPGATLDVNGTLAARGALTLESGGTATSAAGNDSQPLQFAASAYNASTKTAAAPLFSLRAEPLGNDTTTPSGTLNLLYGNGTMPTETGLSISSKGLIKFAPGQTFPGSSTITGITTTSPLTGNGTTGSIALGLNLPALVTTLNSKYAQLGAANKFTQPIIFATGQTFPGTGKGTITSVTTTSPLTGSGATGSVALSLNLPVLETILNAKYAQLGAANKFTQPITFAPNQTFPGISGGGTITGVTTASPLLGSGTKGTVALSLNLPVLETTLNTKYAQLGAANKFTQLISFATGQTFPGTGTITAVTAGTGLTGGGTTGAIKLALDPKAIPTLTGSPVFNGSSGDGMVGDTAGNTVGTAGVLGVAGSGNTSGFGGIAGVWGNASAHVGVLGTSDQYAGVQGISNIGYGVQGSSSSGIGLQGISISGPGISGSSKTSDGVVGSTNGTSLYTAGVLGSAGARTSFQGIAGVWGDAAAHVGVFGSSNQYAGVQGQSTQGQGVLGVSVSNSGLQGYSTSGTGVAGTSTTANGMLGYTAGGTKNTAGVLGGASGPSGYGDIAGVWGDSATHDGVFGSSVQSAGVNGVSGNGNGVYGVSYSTSTAADVAGVYGYAATQIPAVRGLNAGTGPAALFTNASADTATMTAINNGVSNGTATAVLGVGGSEGGIGVEGETIGGIAVLGAVGLRPPGNGLSGYAGNVAIWGDATANEGVAVMGNASNSNAAYFTNNSAYSTTIYARNYGSGDTGQDIGLFGTLEAATPRGSCGFGGNGDLTCTGQVKALTTTGNGARTVETYSMQSPENWMEDFGSGTLQNGHATVSIDAAFAETVSDSADYHIFLTPRGDSKGLYVTNAIATSFEVHESGGGTSTISFDYRVVAKRRGFETQRMVDVTETMRAVKARGDLQAGRFKRPAK